MKLKSYNNSLTHYVSDDGKVFLKQKNRFSKAGLDLFGYRQVGFKKGRVLVHRMVAETFIKNPKVFTGIMLLIYITAQVIGAFSALEMNKFINSTYYKNL